MNVPPGPVLAKCDVSKASINDDYNAKSGHTDDENSYFTKHHDYSSYNRPKAT